MYANIVGADLHIRPCCRNVWFTWADMQIRPYINIAIIRRKLSFISLNKTKIKDISINVIGFYYITFFDFIKGKTAGNMRKKSPKFSKTATSDFITCKIIRLRILLFLLQLFQFQRIPKPRRYPFLRFRCRVCRLRFRPQARCFLQQCQSLQPHIR